ncbi:MAG: O-antigen ligase family protein [Ignavibacteriaceae bacterium]
MNDLYFWLLAIIVAAFGAALIYFCFKRFEIAVFMVGFSVWLPNVFLPNSHEAVLMQDETGIGSYVRIVILLAMGLVGLIKFIQYLPEHKGRIPVQFTLVGLFLVLAFASVTYSLDPGMSFIRAATFLALVLFLLGLYTWIKEEEQLYKLLNSLFYLTLVLIILSAIAMVAMPARAWWWYISNRFIGIWGHPNTTGMFCLTAYPVLMWKFSESNTYQKIMIAGLILFVLFMHILTGSRTSLFASAIGISLWFILQRKALKTVITLGVIAFGLFVLIQLRPQSLQREESSNITDVTGREEFWDAALQLVEERPLTGYGYSVKGEVWLDPRFYKEGYDLWSGSSRASLHNGYLSVAVGVGVIGLFIWLAAIFIPFFRAFLTGPDIYKSFALSVMLMMILVNFAESSLDSTASIGAIFFWTGWIIAGKIYQLKKAEAVESEEYKENYAAYPVTKAY